ncbi:MAG: hypothetical protein ABFR90_06575 [Planctomycetota bacterium]
MPIRHEDKEFIQALALLGALLGACLGVFTVVHLSDSARETYSEQTEYSETQAALLKLKTTAASPSSPISDEEVLTQVQQHIPEAPEKEVAAQEDFWLRLPRWAYFGLCGGGGIAGAFAGYFFIWLTGWMGALFVLYFIRSMYRTIGCVAPNSAAARKASEPNNAQTYQSNQRRDDRVLPILTKLCFLLLFVLAILAAVVWRLTAL